MSINLYNIFIYRNSSLIGTCSDKVGHDYFFKFNYVSLCGNKVSKNYHMYNFDSISEIFLSA